MGAGSYNLGVRRWTLGVRRYSGELRLENEEKFEFENLRVYQRALEYIDFVYKITKIFPKAETFSLTDQFRRASTSISLNIAEGSGGSDAEFNQFLKIARRSIRECIAITEIAHRQGFINKEVKRSSRVFCLELSKMISGLMRSLKNKGKDNGL